MITFMTFWVGPKDMLPPPPLQRFWVGPWPDWPSPGSASGQTTAPTVPAPGELGMPPRPGRPRGYLPGAPDGPPSPPAPTDGPPPAPGHKFSAAMVDDAECRMLQCDFYFQYRMYRAASDLKIMLDDFRILRLRWILIVK